jgi:type III restriction enzyme
VLSTADIPTRTENAPIVGESSIHTLDDLKQRRDQEVFFLLAKLTLEKYFRADGQPKTERGSAHRFDPEVQSWLFPQILAITRRWLAQCVTLKDGTFIQLLLLHERAHDAADRIYHAIVAADHGVKTLKPILRPYDTVGSTRYVDFDTTKSTYKTRADKCHVSHVVADTTSWEQKLAESLEAMHEVVAYVKNDRLGFTIPYTLNGEEHSYYPDFIVRVRQPDGSEGNLIIEVTGEKKKDKEAKVATARALWVPAVNNHGGFGRWAFVEITDPWNAQSAIRSSLAMLDTSPPGSADQAPPRSEAAV